MKSNPNALISTQKGAIFTNVARNLDDNTVWWESLDKNPPVNAEEWKGGKVNGPEYIAGWQPSWLIEQPLHRSYR